MNNVEFYSKTNGKSLQWYKSMIHPDLTFKMYPGYYGEKISG